MFFVDLAAADAWAGPEACPVVVAAAAAAAAAFSSDAVEDFLGGLYTFSFHWAAAAAAAVSSS